MTAERVVAAVFFWMVSVSGCATDSTNQSEVVGIPEFGLVESVRVGSIDDPTYAFTEITSAAIGPDGTLYTLHGSEYLVRRFAPDGSILDEFGRQGEGPGEFTVPLQLGFVGDTLWVAELRDVIHFFSPDGEVLRTTAPLQVANDTSATLRYRPAAVLPDGSLLFEQRPRSLMIAKGEVTERPLLRLDPESGQSNLVASLTRANSQYSVLNAEKTGGTYGSQLFGDSPLYRVAPTEPYIFLLDRAVPHGEGKSSFSVFKLTLNGDTVARWAFPFTPREIPAAVVEDAVAIRVEDLLFFGEPDPLAAERNVRDALYLPRFMPPVDAMIVALDGTIWMRTPDANRASGEDGQDTWLVSNGSGEIVGRVSLPPRSTILSASLEQLWIQEVGPLDVPQLVRYAVDTAG